MNWVEWLNAMTNSDFPWYAWSYLGMNCLFIAIILWSPSFWAIVWVENCRGKVNRLLVNRDMLTEDMDWLPHDSLEYQRKKLGIALTDLMMEMWKAMGGI